MVKPQGPGMGSQTTVASSSAQLLSSVQVSGKLPQGLCPLLTPLCKLIHTVVCKSLNLASGTYERVIHVNQN